jgi:tripartite-type tricarboxylate transporter receptor subunit TctC
MSQQAFTNESRCKISAPFHTENAVKILPLILLVFAAHHAQAQDYPNRPVRVLVGLGAGGGSDTVARIMTHQAHRHAGAVVCRR